MKKLILILVALILTVIAGTRETEAIKIEVVDDYFTLKVVGFEQPSEKFKAAFKAIYGKELSEDGQILIMEVIGGAWPYISSFSPPAFTRASFSCGWNEITCDKPATWKVFLPSNRLSQKVKFIDQLHDVPWLVVSKEVRAEAWPLEICENGAWIEFYNHSAKAAPRRGKVIATTWGKIKADAL